MLKHIVNMVRKKPSYYKIVRVYDIGYPNVRKQQIEKRHIRHSCYIPLYHPCGIEYMKNKWVYGDNLFVFTSEIDIRSLMISVLSLSYSNSILSTDENDKEKNSHFELWKCKAGTIQTINDMIMSPSDFLNNIEGGKDKLNRAVLSEKGKLNVPQVVTNKVKLTTKIYEDRVPATVVNL